MIDITDLTVDRLADAWQCIRDTSPADEADPFVLDCARRLAADPGGERAHLWVSGLLAMSGHLARRPGRDAGRGGRDAERAALDALRAAAKGLGGRACPHEDHPYEAEMDALEDEVWLGDNGLLSGELHAQEAALAAFEGLPSEGRDGA
ncbi:hypothetical protein ACFCZ1_03035 [Streptomyces sp. NPDC056224]|uniref:hypothetical protein n=1 Tax=Streptomyces sp. NPDC056224 TaxID=3345750 RepID=UPI0035E13578